MKAMTERASQFTSILTEVAADEEHIIRTVIHFDEMRPLEDDDLPQSLWWREGCSPSGFYCYEDAGMTTGSFLASQSLRYLVTGKEEAKHNADNAFRGVCFIYELGKEKVEGYFPKPYGKKISDQISRDQYLYVLNGLANYHRIVDEKTQRQIQRMMAKMADYWISINYTDSYFGLPASSNLRDFMGPLFLGIMRIPYTYTGDKKYLREYERLFAEERLGARMPETLRGLFLRGEKYDGATYFRQQENPVMMKTMAIDHLWPVDSEHGDLWRQALQAFRDDVLTISLERNSGLNYNVVGFDVKRNSTFMTEPGVIKELENPLNLPFLTWGGLRKTAGSAQIAYAAAVIGDRLGDRETIKTAADILGKMDLSKFRGFTVPDKSHLPPGYDWEIKMLHSCYLSYWLWAYWLGRARKLWND